MASFQPDTYGERIADIYDSLYPSDPRVLGPMLDNLEKLVRGGTMLELGIGTGRVALPLVERGIDVHGIDASPRMVERLRGKPGGADIPVTIGDFSSFDLGRRFDLIAVVFNTFFGLLDQDQQIRCLSSVARHLSDRGRFVMECFVPDPSRFRRGQHVAVSRIFVDRVHLEVSRHDPVAQIVDAQHMVLGETGVSMYPVRIRYAWPAEIDLMARLAGLKLVERRGGWDDSAFSAGSGRHISIFEKQ